MEIRNNYNSATTFGTKIPQPIQKESGGNPWQKSGREDRRAG